MNDFIERLKVDIKQEPRQEKENKETNTAEQIEEIMQKRNEDQWYK